MIVWIFFFSNVLMLLIFQGVNIGIEKPNRNKIFGVFIPIERHKDEEVLEVIDRYKRKNRWWFWVSIATNFLMFFQTKYFSIIYTFFLLWMFVVIGYKLYLLGHATERLKQIKKNRQWFDINRDQEEEYWRFGMFYFNPNSSKLWVSQQGSMNTTVNLSTRKGKWFMGIMATLLFVLLVPISIQMILEDFMPPKITLTEESLAIKSTMYEVSIDYEDIEKVEIVVDEGHQTLRGAKQSGSATDYYSRGKFYVGSYEKSFLSIFHETIPVIVIHPSNDQRTILFNDVTDEKTYKLLEQLKSHLE